VIDVFARPRVQGDAVYTEDDFSTACGVGADSIAFAVDTPSPLREITVVFIVDERDETSGQRNPLSHVGSDAVVKLWGRSGISRGVNANVDNSIIPETAGTRAHQPGTEWLLCGAAGLIPVLKITCV
jgi:hypothetical protein